MSLLEQRYRFVLRLLPASYRAQREEEMVDAFLNGSSQARDEDNARPRWSEVASIAALSLRVRFGGPGGAPRHLAVGDAVRLVAVLGLGYQAVLSWLSLVAALPAFGFYGFTSGGSSFLAPGIQGWTLATISLDLLWIATFAALVLGRRRVARALVVLCLLGETVLAGVLAIQWPGQVSLESTAITLLWLAPAVALLVAFHKDAPRTRPSPALAVLPLGIAVLYNLAMVPLQDAVNPPAVDPGLVLGWVEPRGVGMVVFLVAAVVCLARGSARSGAWPLALAILAVPLIATRLPYWALGRTSTGTEELVNALLAQCVYVAVLAVVLAVVGLRALPRTAPPYLSRDHGF